MTAPRRQAVLIALLWVVLFGFTALRFATVPIWQRDFFNYWLAPRAIWSGVNPYDVVAFANFGLAHHPGGLIQQFNFTYPPHSLFLFAPFSLLPPYVSIAGWDLVSLAAFILAARPYLPKDLPVFAAVLSPATLICLDYGQTGLLTSALFLWAFRGSGLAAAVLTFKPHLGFLVAPALLIAGKRPVLAAIAFTVLLVAASALAFGYWPDFFAHAGGYQASQLFRAEKVDPYWLMIGVTPVFGYGPWGILLFSVPALVLLARNFNVFTAATATFLISPYGFHYDMSAACLGFVVLLFSCWGRMPWWHRLVAALAFLSPVIVNLGTWWVPPLLLLGLFVQSQWLRGIRATTKGRRIATEPVNAGELLHSEILYPSGR